MSVDVLEASPGARARLTPPPSMLELLLDADKRRPLQVLCVGAHCDDIEIGCGATLRALQRRSRKALIRWVVLSGTPKRRAETERAMR